ncbi:hypothetical protein E1281_24805 [Actinomadura sp. KC345]|uniref:hypothetical protein n=1 Tax=Actinomadura sp. KC345 TaxID=2530371 RepID=UPI00104DD83F|nr:hypothetical protein [Actinomadura sp. KC345]TDC48406.1 hypothetical protein E1281_24805 [Actinomadura sp. KC345]
MSVEVAAVFWTVVGARFLLPLLILRYPLPAIVGCLVLDAVDQTIFQSFGYDPPGYQGYDKAMDVYYLALAYLATMRNWTNGFAFQTARFLYFYRLVGVVAFELSQWRAFLLVFPNTFEYFFIAYEGIRSRWDPVRFLAAFWLTVAALIWIVIKLPQEYWVHVAQLDFTDTVADVPWFGPAVVIVLLAAAAVFRFAVRPRLRPADRQGRLTADPLPEQIDTAEERDDWSATHGRVLSLVTVEKIFFVGLISVLFAEVLPGLRTTGMQLFLALAVLVVLNAAFSLWTARVRRGVETAAMAFLVRLAFNVGLVLVAEWLLGREGGRLDLLHTAFFMLLLSLLTTLHDRYRPVYEVRAAEEAAAAKR